MARMLEVIHRMLAGELPQPPIARLIGFQLTEIGDGRAVIAFEATREHANPMGTLHGGVLCDIADAAMGMAYASTLAEDETFTTRFLVKPDANTALAALLALTPGEANGLVLRYREFSLSRGNASGSLNLRLAAPRSAVRLARLLGLVTWSLDVPGMRTRIYRDMRGLTPGASRPPGDRPAESSPRARLGACHAPLRLGATGTMGME